MRTADSHHPGVHDKARTRIRLPLAGSSVRTVFVSAFLFGSYAAGMSLFSVVDHVGIAVPDLDEAVEWYRETFGFELVHEETNDEQGVREAMLQVSPGDEGTRLQLLAPLGPDSPIARFLERSGPGLQQIAYRVDDVESVAASLRAKGLRVLYDTARRGTAGSLVNFVHPQDAGGVLVELVQPAG